MTDAQFRPLKSDRRPLYVQAIETLREMIEAGEYKAGDLLPSEEELARLLAISRSTLREAMGHLESGGLIVRKQGVGTYVTERTEPAVSGGLEDLETFRSLTLKAGLKAQLAERRVESHAATSELAEPLGVDVGSELVRIEVVEMIEDHRSAYLDTYVPVHVAGLDQIKSYDGSIIDYLCQHESKELSHTRSEIYAVDAGPQIAKRLQIPVGKSVLNLIETYFDKGDNPIALSNNHFLTENFRYVVVRRRS
jgi:GntR family transcriptional regulator